MSMTNKQQAAQDLQSSAIAKILGTKEANDALRHAFPGGDPAIIINFLSETSSKGNGLKDDKLADKFEQYCEEHKDEGGKDFLETSDKGDKLKDNTKSKLEQIAKQLDDATNANSSLSINISGVDTVLSINAGATALALCQLFLALMLLKSGSDLAKEKGGDLINALKKEKMITVEFAADTNHEGNRTAHAGEVGAGVGHAIPQLELTELSGAAVKGNDTGAKPA